MANKLTAEVHPKQLKLSSLALTLLSKYWIFYIFFIVLFLCLWYLLFMLGNIIPVNVFLSCLLLSPECSDQVLPSSFL